jgi:putative hydrolases of HD superfamily
VPEAQYRFRKPALGNVMNGSDIVTLLLHGNQLKRTARTGWAQRGVPGGENVAAHTFGVAYTTLVLANLVDEEVDLARALAMALLHDLPEGLTTDIPTPALRFLSRELKAQMEAAALQEIAGKTPLYEQFGAWWQELDKNESIEARLVHDADRIDLFLQAVIFEEQTGNRHLAQFWEREVIFAFDTSQRVYEVLRARQAAIGR